MSGDQEAQPREEVINVMVDMQNPDGAWAQAFNHIQTQLVQQRQRTDQRNRFQIALFRTNAPRRQRTQQLQQQRPRRSPRFTAQQGDNNNNNEPSPAVTLDLMERLEQRCLLLDTITQINSETGSQVIDPAILGEALSAEGSIDERYPRILDHNNRMEAAINTIRATGAELGEMVSIAIPMDLMPVALRPPPQPARDFIADGQPVTPGDWFMQLVRELAPAFGGGAHHMSEEEQIQRINDEEYRRADAQHEERFKPQTNYRTLKRVYAMDVPSRTKVLNNGVKITRQDDCLICTEPFDKKEHKPYIYKHCGHMLCAECAPRMTKMCSVCRKEPPTIGSPSSTK